MGMSKKIKVLLALRGYSQSELAQRLGTTRANLHGKMTRDNFTESDLLRIAEALDCTFEAHFVLRDSGEIV